MNRYNRKKVARRRPVTSASHWTMTIPLKKLNKNTPQETLRHRLSDYSKANFLNSRICCLAVSIAYSIPTTSSPHQPSQTASSGILNPTRSTLDTQFGSNHTIHSTCSPVISPRKSCHFTPSTIITCLFWNSLTQYALVQDFSHL